MLTFAGGMRRPTGINYVTFTPRGDAKRVEEVAHEQGKKLAPLCDDLVLLESGLDSLCMAIIVARLEDSLGLDPFNAAECLGLPVTLGDLIRLYEQAAR
jgi:hypothetical protein